MGTTILVGELDKSAVKLVNALDLAKFDFAVAALMKDDDADDWFIVLGITGLREKGLKQFLSAIYDIIEENNIDLSLYNIKLKDDESEELLALRKVFGSARSVFRTVLGNTYANGIKFSELILYRAREI